ncbi:hypothetical protein RJ640_013539 [Escallonia rubra]|uniref:Uncharacterized protein n=1 Tax=Escallonia rubra TaxID=112253 RepID=A0AA88U7Y9_9ASTE|nr:hypothetical protein RJ640_013539 [Escallonia rubra]
MSQLSSIDVKLEEEDQMILLLSSLPKSYETLKTTLLIRNETWLVNDVTSALMDSSRVNGTSSSSQGEGLVVRFAAKAWGVLTPKSLRSLLSRSQRIPLENKSYLTFFKTT